MYSGIIPGRAKDVAGLGVAHAQNGSPFRRALDDAGFPLLRAETVIELTYKAQLNAYLQVQPDLRYVINPGTSPDSENALVVGIRGIAILELP